MAAISHDYWRLGLCHGTSYVSPSQQILCYRAAGQAGQSGGGGQANALLMTSAGVCGEPTQAVGGSSAASGASGGDYAVNIREVISSPQSAYEVLELLGEGRGSRQYVVGD